MTEYLLFIHGVNTRETRDQPSYANQLIEQIQRLRSSQMEIEFCPLYWGDVNIEAERDLQGRLEESPVWDKLYFKEFRAKQLLQFVGDAALYISRAVGRKVVEKLIKDAQRCLQRFNPQADHIHLITHSLGTIILFDILFSSRWDGYGDVEELRNLIFQGGSPIRSIHTMGSPLGLFSLTMVSAPPLPNTHDVTVRLRQYLQDFCSTPNAKLIWRNYLHPMDLIATSIEQLLPNMLGSTQACLDIKDVLTQEVDILDQLSSLFSRTLIAGDLREQVEKLQLALLAGQAHSSYWSSPAVASTIVQTIEATV